jgi:hypothetical protein
LEKASEVIIFHQTYHLSKQWLFELDVKDFK